MYREEDKIFLKNLGGRIREIRTKVGLSQEKLSYACDLDRTYVGSVERGERNISVINLQKIAKALEISIAELFNFDDE